MYIRSKSKRSAFECRNMRVDRSMEREVKHENYKYDTRRDWRCACLWLKWWWISFPSPKDLKEAWIVWTSPKKRDNQSIHGSNGSRMKKRNKKTLTVYFTITGVYRLSGFLIAGNFRHQQAGQTSGEDLGRPETQAKATGETTVESQFEAYAWGPEMEVTECEMRCAKVRERQKVGSVDEFEGFAPDIEPWWWGGSRGRAS